MVNLSVWRKRIITVSPDPAARFSVPSTKTTTATGSTVFLFRNSIFLPNPTEYTDPDGNDMVLLNRSYGAIRHGHNAVLVGNNNDGWILYSKDDFNINTRKAYNTIGNFLSENNRAKRKDSYDISAFLKTSESQDKAMQEYGDQIYNQNNRKADQMDLK
jgi:hypothetical protein